MFFVLHKCLKSCFIEKQISVCATFFSEADNVLLTHPNYIELPQAAKTRWHTSVVQVDYRFALKKVKMKRARTREPSVVVFQEPGRTKSKGFTSVRNIRRRYDDQGTI